MNAPTLLVIDDEPAITTLIKRIAEPCGYRVLACSDPDAFKQHFMVQSPDLICIDLAMPGTDGIELMRFLAQSHCRAPLMIMSGSDPRLRDSALRLGEALGLELAGNIAKPLRIDALRDLLTTLREAA